jgi:predicted nucleic acid-binding protein
VSFVLDTNAVSEIRKPRPNAGLLRWLAAQDSARLFITTITLAEVWHGFHRLEAKHPDYENIKQFASGLTQQFRVLNFDVRAAAIWGELTAACRAPLPLRDSLIAAIARSRGCRVATRDTAPFARMGCKVSEPWS